MGVLGVVVLGVCVCVGVSVGVLGVGVCVGVRVACVCIRDKLIEGEKEKERDSYRLHLLLNIFGTFFVVVTSPLANAKK